MMKKFNGKIIISAFIIISTLISSHAFADTEWTTAPNGYDVFKTNSGNVGIGTTQPTSRLQINTDVVYPADIRFNTPNSEFRIGCSGSASDFWIQDLKSSAFRFYIGANGNVGIGTIEPTARFQIDTDVINPADIRFKTPNSDFRIGCSGSGSDFWIKDLKTNAWRFYIGPDGNIGIGTTTPGAKLDIAGTVWAREIRVTASAEVKDLKSTGSIAANDINVAGSFSAGEIKVNNANWSDFVFEDSYKLPSLDKVETYIKENKHLPEIPSAEQVSKDGISVSNMMAKQMQKIEELTLYVIELKKENKGLRERMDAIEHMKK